MVLRHLKIVLWHNLLLCCMLRCLQQSSGYWGLKTESFICGSHSIKWLQIQHRNSDVYICTIYTMLRKILNLSYKMSIFLVHLVMTIYINYHFVWVAKWNLNIIKEHVTFKQHLRNIAIELLHWKSCTRIQEHWGVSNLLFWKVFNPSYCKSM